MKRQLSHTRVPGRHVNQKQQATGRRGDSTGSKSPHRFISSPLVPASSYRRPPARLLPGETRKLLESGIPGAEEDMREDQSLKTRRVGESQHGKWRSPPCPLHTSNQFAVTYTTAPTAPRSTLQSLSLD